MSAWWGQDYGGWEASPSASSGQKRSTPCWFYAKGMCTKGDACIYKHEGGIDAFEANLNAEKNLQDYLTGNKRYAKYEGNFEQGRNKRIKVWDDKENALWNAVKVALEHTGCVTGDGEECERLCAKITGYARSAAQGLEPAGKSLAEILDDFARDFLSRLFQTLGDKPWLTQLELLLVFEAAVREHLPSSLLQFEAPALLEQLIIEVHARTFEEFRAMAQVWEIVQKNVQGQKTRSKVYKACETAWKEAATDSHLWADPGAESWAKAWITLWHMHISRHGDAETILPLQEAISLFLAFVQAGALPSRCMAEFTLPREGWVLCISTALQEAYGTPMSHEQWMQQWEPSLQQPQQQLQLQQTAAGSPGDWPAAPSLRPALRPALRNARGGLRPAYPPGNGGPVPVGLVRAGGAGADDEEYDLPLVPKATLSHPPMNLVQWRGPVYGVMA